MQTTFLISVVSLSLLVSACDTNSNFNDLTAKTNQRISETNPIISSEPSENVSLDDYRDDANSILAECYQLIERAKQSRCKDAQIYAQKTIILCEAAQKSTDKSEAESIIGKANESLINSEDALALCEENQNPENQ